MDKKNSPKRGLKNVEPRSQKVRKNKEAFSPGL
jgi:hypothetical protein